MFKLDQSVMRGSLARRMIRLTATLGSALVSPWAAAEPAVSPFSIAFFPKASQWEWNGRIGVLASEHRTVSALLRHEGTTVTGLLTPGFRWGWREDLAMEVSQPVAHRFQVDPHNPNVGPQGLRAPTVSAIQRLGRAQEALDWRLAGMVQINPWNSSGLNQWGGSVAAVVPAAPGGPASLTLGASRYPETGMSVVTVTGAWEVPVGAWLLQGNLGVGQYSAFTTAAARMQEAQGWSAGLEASRQVHPGLWAGLSYGVADHRQQLSTVPTAKLPLALPVSNRTAVQTLTLTLRSLY
jgi:hypothetical protein